MSIDGDEIDRAYTEYLKSQVEEPPADWDYRTRYCDEHGHVPVKVRICRFCATALGLEEED